MLCKGMWIFPEKPQTISGLGCRVAISTPASPIYNLSKAILVKLGALKQPTPAMQVMFISRLTSKGHILEGSFQRSRVGGCDQCLEFSPKVLLSLETSSPIHTHAQTHSDTCVHMCTHYHIQMHA